MAGACGKSRLVEGKLVRPNRTVSGACRTRLCLAALILLTSAAQAADRWRAGQQNGDACATRRPTAQEQWHKGVFLANLVQAADIFSNPIGVVQSSSFALPEDFWLQYLVRRGLLLLIVVAVLAGIWLARRGRILPLRDIPGLTVFEEAVSRATEMGRPTLFTVGGACDLKKVQLYASMPLLREVARLTGELGNRLIIPVCYAEAMPVHINAIRDGYIDAGAMGEFKSEDLRFFPGGQFFFAIASMGWMLEERPAACFYFGWWEADSLMFAETGQTIQAMQIAGTDQLYQIPFFVAACDYTIIGEEFWAASAKLSRSPHLLGSLGAQDIFKLGMLALVVIGCLLCALPPVAELAAFLQRAFQ